MRLVGIDAARAAAIVGMFAVNVGPRDGEGALAFIYGVPLGRASLLFVVLAGVGLSLMTRRSRQPGGTLPWRVLLWRAALLLVGGLALQGLEHDVRVILPQYALLFLLALPLLRVPDRALAWAAGVGAVVAPVLWLAAQWIEGHAYEFEPAAFGDPPLRILHSVVLSGPYPVLVWVVPFVFGLWLGRLDLSSHVLRRRLLVWGLAATVVGFGVYRILLALVGEPSGPTSPLMLISAVDHSQMPLWLLSGVGSAAACIGLFLLLEPFVRRRLRAVVDLGRLALTSYVVHLLVLAAWVRPEPTTVVEGVAITLGLSIGCLLFATLWLRRFANGPFEVLLRVSWLRRRRGGAPAAPPGRAAAASPPDAPSAASPDVPPAPGVPTAPATASHEAPSPQPVARAAGLRGVPVAPRGRPTANRHPAA